MDMYTERLFMHQGVSLNITPTANSWKELKSSKQKDVQHTKEKSNYSHLLKLHWKHRIRKN